MFPVVFAAGLLHYVMGFLLFLTSVFLILLVLVQRGRGGGLTGALGGMGGQSAFGAKAGDMFTRVTMVTATIWILLCLGAIRFLTTADDWGAGAAQRPGMENLEGLDVLPETDLPETDLPETDLPETDLPETDLPETDLPESELPVTEPEQVPAEDEAAVNFGPEDDATEALDEPPADPGS